MTTIDRDDLHNLGPVVRDPDTDRRAALELVSITAIKEVVDMLADLNMDPLHLRVDGHKIIDTRPSINMWMRYRTDFDAVCDRLKIKTSKRTERRFSPEGQREWWAEHDIEKHRMLVQVVSFAHHYDWEPRPRPTVEPAADPPAPDEQDTLFGGAA